MPENQEYQARHFATPQSSGQSTPPENAQAEHPAPAAEVTDQGPVLASVDPAFNTAVPEGLDATTLPPFKDMTRSLPAARIRVQMDLAKFATAIPKSLQQAGEVDLSTMNAADMDAIANMIEGLQNVILDNAQDRQAMENWLIDQADPVSAVMHAFNVFQDTTGN